MAAVRTSAAVVPGLEVLVAVVEEACSGLVAAAVAVEPVSSAEN